MLQQTSRAALGHAPFGDPDGARQSLETLMERFVDFDERFGGLSTRAGDMRARVIVGRTGAGKTVYLRRLRASAENEASVYAEMALDDALSTDAVVATCQLFDRRDVFEIWRRIWSRAITRTAVAHILRTPALRDQVDEDVREALIGYPHLIGTDRTPGTLYGHVAQSLHDHGTRRKLAGYLNDSGWSDVNHFLRAAIARLPPMAFYVDGLDDAYSRAPSYWMPVQEGLFKAVMQWLRDPVVGGRLHVVVAVRDVVYSYVLRGGTAGRYRGDPHVRVLDWDGASLTHLLRSKIDRLDDRHLARPGEADPIRRWLGAAQIRNVARGTDERLEDYLLRHIRLIPRDVVQLGNDLCRAVLTAGERDGSPPDAETIRRLVSGAAYSFGNEQLAQCADQVSADMAPARSAQHGYVETYTGKQAYLREPVLEAIRGCLRDIGVDRFDAAALKGAQEQFHRRLEGSSDLVTVLWQNGLLGFTGRRNGGEGSYFYRVSGVNDLQPPMDQREYLLHPSLIDAVGVRGVGSEPITPHR